MTLIEGISIWTAKLFSPPPLAPARWSFPRFAGAFVPFPVPLSA